MAGSRDYARLNQYGHSRVGGRGAVSDRRREAIRSVPVAGLVFPGVRALRARCSGWSQCKGWYKIRRQTKQPRAVQGMVSTKKDPEQ